MKSIVYMKNSVVLGSRSESTKTEEILEYVHSDVWGSIKVGFMGGFSYFMTFIEYFSHKV